MAKDKDKKIISNVENLELGNKLKDISIDMKKYSFINLLTLIILNILLIGVMIYYLTISNNGLILTLTILTVVACVIWSVMSFLKSVIKVKYSIYENAIVKDFDSSQTIGIYANLEDIKITQTLLDKIGKNKTNSLVLKFCKPGAKKIHLFCIDEDIKAVAKYIKEHQANAVVVFNEIRKNKKATLEKKNNSIEKTEPKIVDTTEKSMKEQNKTEINKVEVNKDETEDKTKTHKVNTNKPKQPNKNSSTKSTKTGKKRK